MNKLKLSLVIAFALVVSTSANAETTTTVDAAGTAHTKEVERNVEKNRDGSKTIETEVVVEKDPKGLMNKTWAEGQSEVTTNADGSKEEESEVESVDAAGTYRSSEVDSETEVLDNGKTETVTTETKVTDPKGLMNKTKTETTNTIVKDAHGNVISKETETD